MIRRDQNACTRARVASRREPAQIDPAEPIHQSPLTLEAWHARSNAAHCRARIPLTTLNFKVGRRPQRHRWFAKREPRSHGKLNDEQAQQRIRAAGTNSTRELEFVQRRTPNRHQRNDGARSRGNKRDENIAGKLCDKDDLLRRHHRLRQSQVPANGTIIRVMLLGGRLLV